MVSHKNIVAVDADPFPAFYFVADPDPTFHFDADSDPNLTLKPIRIRHFYADRNRIIVRRICHTCRPTSTAPW
jgi:hypothetical protein